MSLAEQALFLLDILPSAQCRKNLENFSNLDQTIVASFPVMDRATPVLVEIRKTEIEAVPFSVASRMSRANYEDQARAEALTQALRQIRASHAAKSSNTRSTGQT